MKNKWQARAFVTWGAVFFTVIAMNAVILGGMAAFGLPLIPGNGVASTEEAPPPPPPPNVVPTQTVAAGMIRNVLQATSETGWISDADITWAAGTPFGWVCGPVAGAAPVVSGQRAFKTGHGQVAVTIRAYGAGTGAAAFDALSDQVGNCRTQDASVGRYTSALAHTEAMIGWVSPGAGKGGAQTLMWRRGDVIASVTVANGNTTNLAPDAEAVDRVLWKFLPPVCADPNSTLEDALRSPWVNRKAYEGMWEPLPVKLPVPGSPQASEAAAASASGTAATPLPVIPGPSPKPTPNVPSTYQVPLTLPFVTVPEKPIAPRWPTALPTPVPSPKKPSEPDPVPTAERVKIKVEDKTGPGCGWAFTGQAAPVFNKQANQQQIDKEVAAAQARLVKAQKAWVADVNAYQKKYAKYVEAAYAFQRYAKKVDRTASAWDIIQSQRDAYTMEVEAWLLDVAARKQFIADRAAAQTEFDATVQVCATYTPDPVYTPEPYVVTPTPSPMMSGEVLVTPTPTPYVTSPPPVTPSPTVTCPPERPTILDEEPPARPVKPTPPPNPMPSSTGYDPGAYKEAGVTPPTPSPTPTPTPSVTAARP